MMTDEEKKILTDLYEDWITLAGIDIDEGNEDATKIFTQTIKLIESWE